MRCSKWCPFGCGKQVIYIEGIQNKISNVRSSVYECQKCGSKFYIIPATPLKTSFTLEDCQNVTRKYKKNEGLK